MQFIALNILSNSFETTGMVVTHTYRYDLKSFLYVLVWVCIDCGWKDCPKAHGDFLSKWYIGTAQEIHRNKISYMKRDSFQVVLFKLTPIFDDIKNLVVEFRDIIHNSNTSSQTTKQDDPNKLYEPIIAAPDRAIQKQ